MGISAVDTITPAPALQAGPVALVSPAGNLEKLKYAYLYGALNIALHQRHVRALEEELDSLSRFAFDGLIVSDIRAAAIVSRRFPEAPLHLSTQANCVNAEAAPRCRDMGFRRIILGRELTLEEIAAVSDRVDVELEVPTREAYHRSYVS